MLFDVGCVGNNRKNICAWRCLLYVTYHESKFGWCVLQ